MCKEWLHWDKRKASSLKKESIRDALEKTKVADIQKWTKENIVITLQQMRCLALNPS